MKRTRSKTSLKIMKDGVEYSFEIAAEGGYIAAVPLYPSCHSQGDTLDEALANIEDALVGCLLAARDLKLPIPSQMEHLLNQPVAH